MKFIENSHSSQKNIFYHGYIFSHLFLDIHDVTFNTQSFVPECEMNQHNTVLVYSYNINIY